MRILENLYFRAIAAVHVLEEARDVYISTVLKNENLMRHCSDLVEGRVSVVRGSWNTYTCALRLGIEAGVKIGRLVSDLPRQAEESVFWGTIGREAVLETKAQASSTTWRAKMTQPMNAPSDDDLDMERQLINLKWRIVRGLQDEADRPKNSEEFGAWLTGFLSPVDAQLLDRFEQSSRGDAVCEWFSRVMVDSGLFQQDYYGKMVAAG